MENEKLCCTFVKKMKKTFSGDVFVDDKLERFKVLKIDNILQNTLNQ